MNFKRLPRFLVSCAIGLMCICEMLAQDAADSNYAAKSISKATLDDLISQGCAFLPAAGYFQVAKGTSQTC